MFHHVAVQQLTELKMTDKERGIGDNSAKETNTKEQKETLLKLGLTKQQIKALKYEEARVKKIIELQEKNKKK